MGKHLLFTDFESYYNTKDKYKLGGVMSTVQYVRDPRFKAFGVGVALDDGAPQWVNVERLPHYLAEIGRVYDWSNIAVVAHNIKFDAFILYDRYGVVPGQFIDTKGMSKAVLGKTVKGHSLDLIAEHLGFQSKGIMLTDGKANLTPEEEDALAQYCLNDVDLCRKIYRELAKEFPENQYEALHRTVDMFVRPQLKLNVPLLLETSSQEATRRANIFNEIGIPKAEFASNVKFPALLISKGYEVPTKYSPKRKDEKGDPVEIPALALGDSEFLEMLESPNEELRTLCEARVAAKSTLLETRSSKLAKVGATGLWPFDVEFSGADQTHRFSGGSGAGGNPQNFTACRDSKAHAAGHLCPGRLRTSVEAPEGFELVVGDFTGVEFRIVAYLSKDPGLVQAIEHDVDIYCDYASMFYGEQVTKKDELKRKFGKTAILGLGYGMGAEKFIKTVRVQTGMKIDMETAKKAVSLYRTRYGKVKELWDTLDSMIQYMASGDTKGLYWPFPGKIGYQHIELPSGLKIRFPNLRPRATTWKNGGARTEWVYDVYKQRRKETTTLYGGKVLENMSQGIAGELCKEAMLEMGDAVTGLVHDEIHVLAKKGLSAIARQKLKRVMSTSPSWFPQLNLDAEVGVGPNWLAAK